MNNDELFENEVRVRLRSAADSKSLPQTLEARTYRRQRAIAHRAKMTRAAVAALAIVVVLGAGWAVRSRSSGTVAHSAATTTTDYEAPPREGLPFLVAPASLPSGWHIVDVSETALQADTTEPASFFLFRRSADGAAVLLSTRADEPGTSFPLDVGSLVDSGQATWSVDGTLVWMRTAGVDANTAEQLAEFIVFRVDDGDVVADLPSSTGFVLEDARLGSELPQPRVAAGVLQITTPNGMAQVALSTANTTLDAVNHFGVPRVVGDTTVYVSMHNIVRDPIEGQISINVYVSNVADIDDAVNVAASLAATDESTWDSFADLIAADLDNLPVTQRLVVDGIEVTERRDGDRVAVCAAIGATTRCRSNHGTLWGNSNDNYSVDLIVDGRWVHAGSAEFGTPISAPVVTADRGDVIGDWVPTVGGGFYAYFLTSGTSATIDIGTAREPGTGQSSSTQRPIR